MTLSLSNDIRCNVAGLSTEHPLVRLCSEGNGSEWHGLPCSCLSRDVMMQGVRDEENRLIISEMPQCSQPQPRAVNRHAREEPTMLLG